MERHYNVTISTDGRPALSDGELLKAVVAAINAKDPEAERYGPAVAGYQVTINNRKMF